MRLKLTHNDREMEVDLDFAGLLDIEDWDNQELELLESQIGAEEMERWFRQEDISVPVFEMVNTLVWCRLASMFPGIGREAFRFKMGPLLEALRDLRDSGEIETQLADLSEPTTE